ncbi:unnamed protein product [Lactuca saligna]|uniref:Uncharacterized protein n=1 Tax=Lactuca saligna TaxID=75948 RepID=A0AA35ZGB0_LACSI|nr:unnamed protein product [Lactuca saligna]
MFKNIAPCSTTLEHDQEHWHMINSLKHLQPLDASCLCGSLSPHKTWFPKKDGQTSKAKSSHKASNTHATRPSTKRHSSSPKVEIATSNYIVLLNTQEQPKEVGVIVKYLHKCPLTYALLSTSPTPQSLITEVFQSTIISTRARSKQLDVEFNLFQATLVLTKEEFAVNLGLSDIPPKPQTFVTPTSAQLLTMFKEMGYKFEDEQEPCLSRIQKFCIPTPWHFLSSVLTRCLFGSVGGRSRGKTNLWILMYGLFYDINIYYVSILWEEIPSHHVSLDYDSLEDNNQDDDKQSKPETIPQGYPVHDNLDKDTPMRTVDIPSSEVLIVDDETNDMPIVLYSNASTRTFSIDLDDYSPSTPKESQEKDDVNEPNLSSFQ